MQRLFEYVILHHPRRSKKEDDDSDGRNSKIVTDVTRILAKDEKIAGLTAARSIPDAFSSKLDELEIIVRPF